MAASIEPDPDHARAPVSPSALAVDRPIDTTEQFLDWLTKVEIAQAEDQESKYSQCVELLRQRQRDVTSILEYVDSIGDTIEDMKLQHRTVEARTQNLQTFSARIIEEQAALDKLADQLGQRLGYFNDLETITKLMHAPGEAICLHDNFIPYIHRLEECIEHVEQNPHYKDAELYLMRFQQCLTRGMTLIKMYCVSTIRTLGADMAKKMVDTDSTAPRSLSHFSAYIYVNFRKTATKLQPLIHELEISSEKHSDYQALLSDCASVYTATRSQLLSVKCQADLSHLANQKGGSLADAIRHTFTFMMDICQQEYQLYHKYFEKESHSFGIFLESLCGHLYSQFRPTIIRETDFINLCDASHSLQAYSTPVDYNGVESVDGHPVYLRPIFSVADKILEEVKYRTGLRAESFINQHIRRYQPSEDELRRIRESESQGPADEELVEDELYPPVMYTCDLLGKLLGSVDMDKYTELTKKAIASCIVALNTAMPKLDAGQPGHQETGRYFYERHMLRLEDTLTELGLSLEELQISGV
ncbi:Sec34-like family-domain-containing protein [Dimargaris cristalligena]|uniref:Conserved oligomeric Golgi complex subunit 3 n=1 Tax=Dimargaris cristalligena TaxID=215637 RepID=A0A4Q0A2A7_9FUNG|nr:Sec34-like family-domain-containing protein [Dimargaris cristalligena]|eukprot:RKP40204.1 Sec34-like family-domain-containing protein [Dimargaris cristalligena]